MSSRRDFLTAFRKPLKKIADQEDEISLRPPYAVVDNFTEVCVNCDDKSCATVCEESVIVIKADGTPILNFSKSGCTFCRECANKCTLGVLRYDDDSSEEINARFIISVNDCVAHHGVICFSCKEPCIDNAILFNGLFNPVIDTDLCTACGFCISRCPSKAISYQPLSIRKEPV